MEGYSRVKLLGEGSFGRVFLMREKKPGGRLVCVKQIHRVHQPKKQAFAPSGREKSSGVEVDLMKKLRHPNLIRLLKSFAGPSPLRQQHIVMEYCSGGDLRNYLKAAASGKQPLCLGEDKIWYWFVQLALGLHHMHQQRVLHRDLKTANIFLSNAGYLVLGDLGIARKLASGDAAATVIGTPLYMAPEVLEGKEYSFSSDVWALGCVLYELCTGKPPFMASTTPQLLNKICHGDYQPIQKTGSLTSSRLPTLIGSMLSLRPELRPSVEQLLRDSIACVHIRRYCVDRLHSTSMTEEEKRVMIQQVTALGIDTKMVSRSPVAEGNNVKNEEHPNCRQEGRGAQHRGDIEKQLQGVRDRERQEQLLFALEKLQQLRLQFPAACHPRSIEAQAAKPLVPPIDLHKIDRKQSVHGEGWRDPVRAVGDAAKSAKSLQPRAPAHLGRSSSVPKGLAFTGVPRPGVPLTGMAKTFAAARRPVCRDVRTLRQQEAAKAAERYKRRLDAMYTPRQVKDVAPKPAASTRRRRSVDETHTAGQNKNDDGGIDAAIVQSMAGLRDALA
ncbi:hypothetical protein PF004_g21523 [Phytophthora fragariae]|uniref:non-specific serine/threonine protein kinase n=1 Tax=Phytophthora fragariae TaxID=53985 RepID=A0A6G0N4M6_9STRA|nr:hypothetical protein PF004_g21523 [Phytophthora fragariae]